MVPSLHTARPFTSGSKDMYFPLRASAARYRSTFGGGGLLLGFRPQGHHLVDEIVAVFQVCLQFGVSLFQADEFLIK